MHEGSEFVSDLFDLTEAGLPGVDPLTAADLRNALSRLISETRSGLVEYTGFQNAMSSGFPPGRSTPGPAGAGGDQPG